MPDTVLKGVVDQHVADEIQREEIQRENEMMPHAPLTLIEAGALRAAALMALEETSAAHLTPAERPVYHRQMVAAIDKFDAGRRAFWQSRTESKDNTESEDNHA